jgi:hypothetical protein
MSLENKDPQDQKNKPQQEHKDGNPVDPMHIPHPLRIRRIRIPLPDIKIFGDLPPNSHKSQITT